MTFLDPSYFHGDIYLPHLISSAGLVGQSAKNQYSNTDNFVADFIAKYEPDFLRKLLGIDLYQSFIEGMKAQTPLQIWIDLKNSIFIETQSGHYQFKYSPAANYVYYWITRKTQTTSTGKGEAKLINSTAVAVSANQVMVDAWRDMREQLCLFYSDFLSKNWNNYKDYAGNCFYPYDFGDINIMNI